MPQSGFIQHRLGRTDGVWLEVDEFHAVLERHGHTVHACAGNGDVPGGQCIPELNRPENRRRLESAPLYDGRRFGPGDRIVLVCAGYVESIGLSGG